MKMNWKATWSLAALSLALSGAATAQDFTGQTLVVGTWGGDIERLLREHAARAVGRKDRG